MPPRKRPHPRSLDALFPPPARPAPPPQLKCGKGHPQSRGWTPGRGCQRCASLAEADRQSAKLAAEAAARPRESVWPDGKVPFTLVMIETQNGKVHRFTIPKHLRRRRRGGI